MKNPLITNIQKYSIHDGSGIRTTFFFKGCPLSCQWCHNPESIDYNKQLLYNEERCTGCGACALACPENAIMIKGSLARTDRGKCTCCAICTGYCNNNARDIIGTQYTVEQLVQLAEKDKVFYQASNGGITLSGGEVMAQDQDFILALVKNLKEKGYHIAIDTCGHAPYAHFEKICPYVNTFLYDIKMINPIKHKQYTGTDNTLILDNLKKISGQGADIHIRIPIIEGVNSNKKDIDDIIKYLKTNIRVSAINLLPYHHTGQDKYERLGLKYTGEYFQKPSEERMKEIVNKFKAAEFQDVKIGG